MSLLTKCGRKLILETEQVIEMKSLTDAAWYPLTKSLLIQIPIRSGVYAFGDAETGEVLYVEGTIDLGKKSYG